MRSNTSENPRAVQSGSSSMLPPAVRNLFEKRFLNFQKLLIIVLTQDDFGTIFRKSFYKKTILVYPGDTGFIDSISGEKGMGRLYENAVFLSLRRNLKPDEEIDHWKDRDGYEVDS